VQQLQVASVEQCARGSSLPGRVATNRQTGEIFRNRKQDENDLMSACLKYKVATFSIRDDLWDEPARMPLDTHMFLVLFKSQSPLRYTISLQWSAPLLDGGSNISGWSCG